MDEVRSPGQYLVDHGVRWHLPEQVRRIGQVSGARAWGAFLFPNEVSPTTGLRLRSMTGWYVPPAAIKCISGESTPSLNGAAGLRGVSCIEPLDRLLCSHGRVVSVWIGPLKSPNRSDPLARGLHVWST
jgi:hypothetical protein